ncbi:hypothetical protein JYU34_002364 [Plutella xylostella]|uniref:Uncharacterized protein n=1 Tax=Plutella xylostella TaxID=51655 RepID=A0ABQ7R207_PLUXY|nr:hypothetical protein JYU34_002364 [Plutella xylostella]
MRSRNSISGGGAPRVVLYAGDALFPLSRALAVNYRINPDRPVDALFPLSRALAMNYRINPDRPVG